MTPAQLMDGAQQLITDAFSGNHANASNYTGQHPRMTTWAADAADWLSEYTNWNKRRRDNVAIPLLEPAWNLIAHNYIGDFALNGQTWADAAYQWDIDYHAWQDLQSQ